MFAPAYLTVVRLHPPGPACGKDRWEQQEGGAPRRTELELLPLTVPEVRHVLWTLVWLRQVRPAHVLQWTDWRRRYLARAERSHMKRCQLRVRVWR